MVKYICVISKMTPDGVPKPLQIIWEDGRIFDIDKILDIRNRASTKGGGAGKRYLVKIKNQERYLFLNNYKWFFELP